jgi:hypothetical protein
MWNFTPDGQAATQILVPATWRQGTTSFYNFSYPANWTGGTYSHGLNVPAAMSGKVIKLAFGSVRYVSQGKQVAREVLSDDIHAGTNVAILGKSGTPNARMSNGIYLLKMSVNLKDKGRQEQFCRRVSVY